MPADLSFIPYPNQRTIVAEALATAHADAEITGLLLAGSLARGDAVRLADVDLYLLLRDGGRRPSRAEMRDGILVEWHSEHPATPAPCWVRLDEIPQLPLWPKELKALATTLLSGAAVYGVPSFVARLEDPSERPREPVLFNLRVDPQ